VENISYESADDFRVVVVRQQPLADGHQHPEGVLFAAVNLETKQDVEVA
jgi:hypothetical protein